MKAIALLSGGLDSILAIRIVAGLGITVRAVYFRHPFCASEKKTDRAIGSLVESLGRQGVTVRIEKVGEEFLEMVKRPRFGYGSNLNTCVDCRILMLKKAREIMEEEKAAFLVTGEVVGQRAMSQQRGTLRLIDREAGVQGLVLRPLSARIMEETIPEKNGWVDRGRLYGFSGRSRKPQVDLAVMLGVIDFPNAAGGCLLTDPRFSQRARDLLEHGEFTMDNVELLKTGRHFRLSEKARLAVGRDERENGLISALSLEGDLMLAPPDEIAGPVGLCRGACGQEEIRLSAMVVCRYCDRGGRPELEISYSRKNGGGSGKLTVPPADERELERLRI